MCSALRLGSHALFDPRWGSLRINLRKVKVSDTENAVGTSNLPSVAA